MNTNVPQLEPFIQFDMTSNNKLASHITDIISRYKTFERMALLSIYYLNIGEYSVVEDYLKVSSVFFLKDRRLASPTSSSIDSLEKSVLFLGIDEFDATFFKLLTDSPITYINTSNNYHYDEFKCSNQRIAVARADSKLYICAHALGHIIHHIVTHWSQNIINERICYMLLMKMDDTLISPDTAKYWHSLVMSRKMAISNKFNI
ncbi:MAG: hypothetical protein ACK5NL_11895 [Vibrio fluvialis]